MYREAAVHLIRATHSRCFQHLQLSAESLDQGRLILVIVIREIIIIVCVDLEII